MQIECPVKIDDTGSGIDSVLFHMCSDDGSWIIIKFIKITNKVARVTFNLYDKVGTSDDWVGAEISRAEPSRAGKVASWAECGHLNFSSWNQAEFSYNNKKQIFTT